jgi:multicomponent Na+:H+ antiporter subunit C
VDQVIAVASYANPLPHVLMLTAIVVGVSTLGVALAILQKIHRVHGTIEEDEILETINE